MNNVEKFYEKKELLGLLEGEKESGYEHFTKVVVGVNRVEINISDRIKGCLKSKQEEYILTIIRKYIETKRKDIEKEVMVALTLDENQAANDVIKDLKLRDIVWIKQEVD